MISSLPVRLGLLCAIWLLTIGVGIAMVLRYENTSGAVGATVPHWPSVTQVALDPGRDTLVMFVHPKCPCTRATVGELNRIMTQCGGHIVAHVFFLQPAGFSDDWVHSGLWSTAAAIPGVSVQADPKGLIGQKFGAETSGYVLLYNPAGQLLFSGGITGSRGHAGDNAGEDAVIALVNGQNPGLTHTLVYGCSLLNEPLVCKSNECTYSTQP
ncbi:MAG TPA: hypothetical protein VNU95_12565 [Candidatus Acidoferrales bacterium]|jgi:hypothetical protein|nr:hypothetical protein [Candidatus Acidoferrales bacterium]